VPIEKEMYTAANLLGPDITGGDTCGYDEGRGGGNSSFAEKKHNKNSNDLRKKKGYFCREDEL